MRQQLLTIFILFVTLSMVVDSKIPTLNQAQRTILEQTLKLERILIAQKYNVVDLDSFVTIGTGYHSLARILTSTYFGRSKFVIGITGGSSSMKDDAWPYLLESRLQKLLNGGQIELRNAAQGGTSQIVTAPCIQALVGEDIDLLFWEFAMNDMGNFERNPLRDGDNATALHPIRSSSAEAWIREAINRSPKAIGFVHIWDIDIETNEIPNIINKAWRPTMQTMEIYSEHYNSYFGVNIIDMIVRLKLYNSKSEFLLDQHHPNSRGYETITDLVLYAILDCWIRGLDRDSSGAVKLGGRTDLLPLVIPSRRSASTQKERIANVIPEQYTAPSCLMSMLPQYSTFSPISLNLCEKQKVLNSNADADCSRNVTTKLIGKADPHRFDRKVMFAVEECDSHGGTGGLYFTVMVPNPVFILLDCGENMWAKCREDYEVYLDGIRIYNNVGFQTLADAGDVLGHYFSFQHSVNTSMLLPAMQHLIRICGPVVKEWGWHVQADVFGDYTFDQRLIGRIVVLETTNLREE